MQSRRLADLLVETGLYAQAHQQYQTVKKEFAADNAWIHHAAALVGLLIYCLLSINFTLINLH